MAELVTGPTSLPISIAEVRRSLRLDNDQTEHDQLIDRLLRSGIGFVEQQTNRALVTQTVRDRFDVWPCDGEVLKLTKGPVQSISSVKYIDTDGAEQTLSSSVYGLLKGEPARVFLKYLQDWPDIAEQPGAISIEYVAGQDAPDSELVMCVLLFVGYFFENRQAKDVPAGLIDYVSTFRIRGL